jgi:RNA polymerase subunit RPABC4/transcription elongation factor Spt4
MDWEAILARGALVLTALAGGYLAALWVVLVVWTYRDVEARSRNVVTQVAATLLAVLFWVPGVLLYLILRPKDTLDTSFQRSLEEEYLLQDLEELPVCPSCQHYVEDDFILCPHCHTRLREGCGGCGRLVALRWSLCPYCGALQDGRDKLPERVEAPAARWTAPALRGRRPAAIGAPIVPLPAGIERREQDADEAAPPRIAGADRAEPVALTVVSGARTLVRRLDRFRTSASSADEGDVDRPEDAARAPLVGGNGNGLESLPTGDAPRSTEVATGTNGHDNGHGRREEARLILPRGRFRVGTNGDAANGHAVTTVDREDGTEDDPFAPAERTPARVEGE